MALHVDPDDQEGEMDDSVHAQPLSVQWRAGSLTLSQML